MKKTIISLTPILLVVGLSILCVSVIFKGNGYPNFTPLTFGSESLVFQLDLQSLNIKEVTEIDWSPDGELFAIGTLQGQISLVNSDTGDLENQLNTDEYSINELVWSPNGSLLASRSGNDGITVLNLEFGVVDEILGSIVPKFNPYSKSTLFSTNTPLVWSPDGKNVVYVDYHNDLLIIHSVVKKEATLKISFSESAYALSWIEEGILIFTGDEILLLDLGKEDFNSIAQLEAVELSRRNYGRFHIYDAKFSSDGILALIDTVELPLGDVARFLRFLDYQKAGDVSTYNYYVGTVLAWSDDGTNFAIGNFEGEVGVISSNYMKIFGNSMELEAIDALAWSPDGKQVVAVTEDDLLVVFKVLP